LTTLTSARRRSARTSHALTGIEAISAPNGSARSYLTLSTLATVLQSQDDHRHYRLTMPLWHGSLFLRWERWPVRRRCAGDRRLGSTGRELLSFCWVFVV
jgi:hypothetical protein